MNLMDSVEKTIVRHFATLTKVPFTFEGATFRPKVLVVSPLLLRGVNCPPGCGGCCRRFTLDWLPSEREKVKGAGYDMSRVKERKILFNGRKVLVLSDLQDDAESYWCRNLGKKDGRCGIHTFLPFSCDFELIRTIQTREDLPNRLTQKLFGRGWAMKRITDGERGAMYSMLPVTDETVKSVIRRLGRFKDWSDHFGIETWAEDIAALAARGFSSQVVFDPREGKKGFGL